MTLPLPELDARRYDDLVAEALRRVPRYTPQWTDHNDSDPGKALIGVNAWLTETLLYQINRVPEQNYIAFLNLLGMKPRPAHAAVTELQFKLKPLKKPADPLTVLLPAATRVAVDDPDLDTEVVFETGGSAVALNADFGLVLIPDNTTPGNWIPVTSFDNDEGTAIWLHAFHPFGQSEDAGRQFIFALVLRPVIDGTFEDYSQDRLPSGQLDLYVEATEVFDTYSKDVGDEAVADAVVITAPLSQSGGVTTAIPESSPDVRWEIFQGAEGASMTFGDAGGWEPLATSLDETEGLRRSGHLTFEVPANATAVRMDQLSAAQWDALNLLKPPQSSDELIAALKTAEDQLGDRLRAALSEEALAIMGLPNIPTDTIVNDILNVCQTGAEAAQKLEDYIAAGGSVKPELLPVSEWAALADDDSLQEYVGPEGPKAENTNEQDVHRRLYFFRATLQGPPADTPRMLNQLRLNTVRGVAASTRQDERVGSSNGRPGQQFTLSRNPVYFEPNTGEPDIELQVLDGSEDSPWQRVDDFYGYGPDSRVYVLDPLTGTITFGDGRQRGRGGAIPPPSATILARRYRFGGGALANVGAGSVSKLKGSLLNVDSVSNPRAAAGGGDAETLDEVIARAPSTLRGRERAVSADDFATLARETPGAAIHKAYAIAATALVNVDSAPWPTAPGTLVPRPGAVTVVILPAKDHPTPQPNEAELRAVLGWLEPRRLVTTELFVTGPRYVEIHRLKAQLRLSPTADFQTVRDAATTAVSNWLHPVKGGDDGTGWPFGADIYHGDVYDLLLSIPGVQRVAQLQVDLPDGVADNGVPDVIGIPEGHLPSLLPGAMNFEVIYDRR